MTGNENAPRNTFPFLLLEMVPPAAPVAFCGKQDQMVLKIKEEPLH